VVDQQGHEQLGAAVAALFINGGDAVAVAIEDDAHCRAPRRGGGAHRFDQLAEIGG